MPAIAATTAEVRLWGRTIGAVSLQEGADVAGFEYEPAFAASKIEVSPLVMPLSRELYRFPELPRESFYGLPGLLADSLPDRFGHALIDAWLASQGRTPNSFNAVERLCYTGSRGMGALEFRPVEGPRERRSSRVEIDQLVSLASEVLSQRSRLNVSLEDDERQDAMHDILRVGTSAGGARAKAVIAWNSQTNEVRSGQVSAPPGFSYWLLKFDGVRGNRDKELADPQGYGAIEYAYYLMARDAGIDINECRLFEENGRRHFMTLRFDRLEGGRKLHMQSLAALAHFDFDLAGAYSYEQALFIMRRLGFPMASLEQQFRRMAFNILGRNQDDHVKNIAFLMNPNGEWSLSPAYDLTYSYNPQGAWTSSHQMTLNGKRDDFVLEDFQECARKMSMKRGRAESILEELESVFRNWPEYASRAGVDEQQVQHIQKNLRPDMTGAKT